MAKLSRNFFVVLVFALLLFYSTGIVSAQLPEKQAGKISPKVWRDYTRALLLKLRPEDKDLINQLRITIEINDEIANAYSYPSTLRMVIFSGIILYVETEDQYAYVIFHEFGHVKLNHTFAYTKEVDEYGDFEINYDAVFKNEREADKFARDSLAKAGRDTCAGYVIAQKTFNKKHPLDPSSPSDLLCMKRIEMMISDCMQKPSPEY